jgi:mannose/fructose-specific phosphotransferase system component IIA
MTTNYFLISHNEYALGLKKALEMIAGKQENLLAYGLMPGNHPDEIAAKIEKQIDDQGTTIILGDIAGGSVCNAVLPLTLKENVILVTGTNLPLALEIVLSDATTKSEIQEIIDKAKKGMTILALEKVANNNGDDFF